MNIKQRGLGRDLQSLLGRDRQPVTLSNLTDTRAATSEKAGDVRSLPMDVLRSGRYQPRRIFDEASLQELAESIRAQGIIQPIIARPIGDKQYEIIAGERRWRAAQLAGLQHIPTIVKDINDETASAMSLIENVQREDLNPMEEALAYSRLAEEFELTHEEISELVGKSRASITNTLRLLQLNSDVKRLLEHGDLEMGHAKALLGLSGHTQSEAARTVAEKNLSVRETEQLVRRYQQPSQAKKPEAKMDPDIRLLQQELSEKLGAKVDIQHKGKSGKLVIHYTNLDVLDGILEKIK
jgi:ParB family chromosome partitioning protein